MIAASVKAMTVNINVKLSTGKQVTVSIPTVDMTVAAFKTAAAEIVDIPANLQRIVYRGKVLKDVDVLKALGVEDGHAVHVVRVAGAATDAAPQVAPAAAAPAPTVTTDQHTTAAAPTTAPAPAPQANPYAALFGVPAPAPQGPVANGPVAPFLSPFAQPAGGMMNQWPGGFGAMPGGMPNVPPQMIQQMMQDPMMRQMMQAMLSNPEMMQNMLAQHPMMQNMTPQQRAVVMQQMADPNVLNMAMNMMGGGGGGLAAPPFPGGNPQLQQPQHGAGAPNYEALAQQLVAMGFPNASANTAALRASQGDIGLAIQQLQLQQLFAAGGAGPAAPAGGQNFFSPLPPVGNPAQVYAVQLQQLKDMGFPNESANLAALQQSQGNIDFAIERLLGA